MLSAQKYNIYVKLIPPVSWELEHRPIPSFILLTVIIWVYYCSAPIHVVRVSNLECWNVRILQVVKKFLVVVRDKLNQLIQYETATMTGGAIVK